MSHQDSTDRSATDRALDHAVPQSMRESLIARARDHVSTTPPTTRALLLDPEAGPTVSDCYRPANQADKERLDRAIEQGRPIATGDAVDYLGHHLVPYEYERIGDIGVIEPVDLSVHDSLRPPRLMVGENQLALFGALLLVALISATLLARDGSSPTAATGAGIGTLFIFLLASLGAVLARRRGISHGVLTGYFIGKSNVRECRLSDDESICVGHAFDSINRLQRHAAWKSEILAGPRAQINLEEEALQIGQFTKTLAALRTAIGPRPTHLGSDGLSLWETRHQVYENGLESLRERATALVALRLAVDDVAERLDQLDRLRSPDADDLATQIVGAMPGNELATAHLAELTANTGGVAEAIETELAMLTATTDELARWATHLPEMSTSYPEREAPL